MQLEKHPEGKCQIRHRSAKSSELFTVSPILQSLSADQRSCCRPPRGTDSPPHRCEAPHMFPHFTHQARPTHCFLKRWKEFREQMSNGLALQWDASVRGEMGELQVCGASLTLALTRWGTKRFSAPHSVTGKQT